MNIVSPKEETNRMVDGIHTILTLPEEEYNLFIKRNRIIAILFLN